MLRARVAPICYISQLVKDAKHIIRSCQESGIRIAIQGMVGAQTEQFRCSFKFRRNVANFAVLSEFVLCEQ